MVSMTISLPPNRISICRSLRLRGLMAGIGTDKASVLAFRRSAVEFSDLQMLCCDLSIQFLDLWRQKPVWLEAFGICIDFHVEPAVLAYNVGILCIWNVKKPDWSQTLLPNCQGSFAVLIFADQVGGLCGFNGCQKGWEQEQNLTHCGREQA